jgi:DNA-directed RNA polymerase sigma subunit (sigma70/sigma32)
VAFSSYVVPTITGEIKRHFRDRAWSVRVPRDLQELALSVDRIVGDLTSRRGRQPSVDEVAEAVDGTPEESSRRCRRRARTAPRHWTRRPGRATRRPGKRWATRWVEPTTGSIRPRRAPSCIR